MKALYCREKRSARAKRKIKKRERKEKVSRSIMHCTYYHEISIVLIMFKMFFLFLY